jgi:hypothetical protein
VERQQFWDLRKPHADELEKLGAPSLGEGLCVVLTSGFTRLRSPPILAHTSTSLVSEVAGVGEVGSGFIEEDASGFLLLFLREKVLADDSTV